MSNKTLTYSVAIRTLGTGGEVFRRELEALHRQTIQPTKILIFIAEGYEKPSYTIGREEYIYVKKGMMSQRLRHYPEIDDDLILFLDDDVALEDDSVERLIMAMIDNEADVVGADTFHNHKMSTPSKIFAAVSNWVFPHYREDMAFEVPAWGTFRYINNPIKDYYPSESCAGPASLWKRNVFESLRYEDELWLQSLGFAYGDDLLIFHKIPVNGYRLGIHFNSGIRHLDSRTSSSGYKKSANRFFIRAFATHVIWHRAIYSVRKNPAKTALLYWTKTITTLPAIIVGSLKIGSPRGIASYFKGLRSAMKFVNSQEYKSLPPYHLS